MTSALLEDWIVDPALPAFSPERRDPELSYFALSCPCGGEVFRLAGWPRLAAGRGHLLWRTIARAWREARQPMVAGEPASSPFLLPLTLDCESCGRSASLFDAPELLQRIDAVDRGSARESYRCRVCRRGRVELVVGIAADTAWGEGPVPAVELVARCHACHRQARVAWADTRPSAQQVRLDHLYGRR